VVLGISNRWLWKCPTACLLAHYNSHASDNHLDVGVGSGYCLNHCQLQSQQPRLAMMDMNNDSLSYSSRRVARYQPRRYQQNILQPIDHDIAKFDSIAVNYLLHCLPGNSPSKTVVFEHLKNVMKPDATLFCSTLLQGYVPRSTSAQQLMNLYNRKGIFSIQRDYLKGLEASLETRFESVQIKIVGCVALFSAQCVSR